jgi:hypothetical protein
MSGAARECALTQLSLESYSPYLLLHSILRILAADGGKTVSITAGDKLGDRVFDREHAERRLTGGEAVPARLRVLL